MKDIPGWDVRAFECETGPDQPAITGHVSRIERGGWRGDSEQYVVEALVRGRSYKFTIIRDEDRWITRLLSTFTDVARVSERRISGIHTFALEADRIEDLFEDALNKLSIYQDDEQ